MFYYTNLYVFLLLSMSMTNVINYFLESSSIVYIAWFGVAMYTLLLLNFFQYSGGVDDNDEKENVI